MLIIFRGLTGFVLLRLKLASWRYQKSSRPITLLPTPSSNTVNENIVETSETMVNDNDEQDVPPITEEIIEQLIQGLRDKAITIRFVTVTELYDAYIFILYLLIFYGTSPFCMDNAAEKKN